MVYGGKENAGFQKCEKWQDLVFKSQNKFKKNGNNEEWCMEGRKMRYFIQDNCDGY